MNEIIDTIEYKGFTINIMPDDCAMDPREWDNLGTMVIAWGHDKLVEGQDIDLEYFKGLHKTSAENWQALEDHIRNELGGVIVLPLYMMDHSGQSIRTRPFGCPWDSGRCGFIYITEEKIVKEYGSKRPSAKKIASYLEAEVERYNDYMTGTVYGYEVEDCEENEFNSCWGFYGTDWKENGLLEAAQEVVDYELQLRAERIEKERKYRQSHLKRLIKSKAPLEARKLLTYSY